MSLWRGIETAPASAPWFNWKLRFEGNFSSVQPWFLKKTNGRAKTVLCPRHCGCIHRATEDCVATCDCGECEDIRLSNGDLDVWQPNWVSFGARVRQVFGLENKTATFPGQGVLQIGTHGGKLPVILVNRPERVAFDEALAQLAARLESFVVVTPTATYHNIQSQELLGRKKAGLIDLETAVNVLPSGQWVALKTVAELFARYFPHAPDEPTDEDLRKIYAAVLLCADEQRGRKAPIKKVFDLYCRTGLSAEEVGLKLRCSKGTIITRLATLRSRTGVEPTKLRTYKPFFDSVEKSITEPRARRIRRVDAARGDDDYDGDQD